jgi:hypothetical protein
MDYNLHQRSDSIYLDTGLKNSRQGQKFHVANVGPMRSALFSTLGLRETDKAGVARLRRRGQAMPKGRIRFPRTTHPVKQPSEFDFGEFPRCHAGLEGYRKQLRRGALGGVLVSLRIGADTASSAAHFVCFNDPPGAAFSQTRKHDLSPVF